MRMQTSAHSSRGCAVMGQLWGSCMLGNFGGSCGVVLWGARMFGAAADHVWGQQQLACCRLLPAQGASQVVGAGGCTALGCIDCFVHSCWLHCFVTAVPVLSLKGGPGLVGCLTRRLRASETGSQTHAQRARHIAGAGLPRARSQVLRLFQSQLPALRVAQDWPGGGRRWRRAAPAAGGAGRSQAVTKKDSSP